MSSEAPAPLQVWLRQVASPEMIAAALSIPVLALALVLAPGLSALRLPSAAVTPSAVPSVAQSSVGPIASGQSASIPPSAPPTVAATEPSSWAPEARVLLQADERLLAVRDRLSAIRAASPINTSEIARQLRSMNATLTATARLIDALASKGAPSDLVADLRAIHTNAFEASVETLAASLPNTAAYRTGSARVIAALDDLEAIMPRVEKAAGSLPSPSP